MNEKDKKRKNLWIYAVVLFLCAFFVLILTAFSQMKLAGNVGEYKDKIKQHEVSLKGYKLNLNTATEERNLLRSKVKQLEEENSNLKGHNILKDSLSSQQIINQTKDTFDLLLEADKLYRENKLTSSAEALRNVQVEYLGEKAKTKYNALKRETYLPAAKKFYFDGRKKMENKENAKAVELFEKSLFFDEAKYYEENTLFYITLTSRRLGEAEKVTTYLDMLKKKYPKSEYIEKVEKILVKDKE